MESDNNVLTGRKISLRDFLKKYTSISSKFIDKYMDLYDMCNKNEYGIDKIDEFKERFRNNFKINKISIVDKDTIKNMFQNLMS